MYKEDSLAAGSAERKRERGGGGGGSSRSLRFLPARTRNSHFFACSSAPAVARSRLFLFFPRLAAATLSPGYTSRSYICVWWSFACFLPI